MRQIKAVQLTVLIIALVMLSLQFLIYAQLQHEDDCSLQHAHGLEQAFSLKLSKTHDIMPILMPVCDRREYMKPVLDALNKCDGISETILIISQDCARPDITDLLSNASTLWPNLHLIWMHHTRPWFSIPSYIGLGNEYATAANVHFLLTFACDILHNRYPDSFQGVIVLESDLLPSRDFYLYHKWAFKHFLSPTLKLQKYPVLTVSSFTMTSRSTSNPYTVSPSGFTVWAWSTSIRNYHSHIHPHFTKFSNWDIHMELEIRRKFRMISIQPQLARVKNIGRLGINFHETDDERWQNGFGQVYINENDSVNYSDQMPILRNFTDSGVCELAQVC